MIYPCDISKYRITQKFGENPAAYAKFGLKGHNGIDIGCPTGTSLVAPISGKVLEATNDPTGYGLYVKIENAQGGCLLGHCLQILVSVGDQVSQGQKVAISDNTGNSTGSHTHFGYYPIPRDRNNGYAGYIDQILLITNDGTINQPTPDMTDDEKRALDVLKSAQTEFGYGNLEGSARSLVGDERDFKGFQITNKEQATQIEDQRKIITELQAQVQTLTDNVTALENTPQYHHNRSIIPQPRIYSTFS